MSFPSPDLRQLGRGEHSGGGGSPRVTASTSSGADSGRAAVAAGARSVASSSPEKEDWQRLRHVLDRHNVTFPEWILLAKMEIGPQRFERTKPPLWLAKMTERRYGEALSADGYHTALDACLRYGWLRVIDQQVVGEVHELLRNDPATLALPKTARYHPDECRLGSDPSRPGKLVPLPASPEQRYGEIDFSPAGAALYRMISAEWLGPDWEVDLHHLEEVLLGSALLLRGRGGF